VTDFSLALWIKPKVDFNSASGEIQIVRTVGGRYELTYNVCGSGIGFAIAYLCGTPASSATTVAADIWYHIAGTYDDTTSELILYLDGALVASFTVAPRGAAVDNSALCIGANCGPARFTNAVIDEVMVYNRALSR